MNTKEVLKYLAEISEYIRGCKRNAASGSRAYEQFGDWLMTVDWVRYQIERAVEEEDDGK